MLARIEVRDFAHIAAASLEFPAEGFCVLTGETGVGKSLLVDAMALGLGGRLGRDVTRGGAQEAEVSLWLAPPGDSPAWAWLDEAGLAGAAGDDILVRRVLAAGRRSRAHVNGRPATVSQLAELGEMLVGICGQHEHLRLADASRRRMLLDNVAGTGCELAGTAAAHTRWQAADKAVTAALAAADRDAGRQAELESLVAEFSRLGLTAERIEEQERILAVQGNAAEIAATHGALEDGLAAATAALETCRTQATRLAELDGRCRALAGQIDTVGDLVDEAQREAQQHVADMAGSDPQALAEAEAFISEAHRLARRHRLPGLAALPRFAAEVTAELEGLAGSDPAALERERDAALAAWQEVAARLHAKRAKAAKALGRDVQASLRQLGMPEARFAVQLAERPAPAPHGADTVAFGFVARGKGDLADLGEAASGGELSRASLALFTHAAGQGGRDLVFDEVDAGIGGRAAAHVGKLLAALGAGRLVMCVTHLPQVAATATAHWRVAVEDGRATFTQVEDAAREEEIARMLAGAKVTQASRANAKEILAEAG